MAGYDTDSETRELVRIDPVAPLPVVYEPTPEEILAEAPDTRDISAELSAPPRRKLPWLTLSLCGGVIAALAFAGGALVEKNSRTGSTTPAAAGFGNFSRNGGAAGGGTGTGTAGGSTTGTVKLVDGSTVYLTDTSGNVVKVTTGKSTTVNVTRTGKLSDLLPGQSVTVRGATDSSGSVAATTVTEGATNPFAGGFGAG